MLDKESDTTKKPFATPLQLIVVAFFILVVIAINIQDFLPFFGKKFLTVDDVQITSIQQIDREGSELLVVKGNLLSPEASQPGQTYVCMAVWSPTCNDITNNSMIYPQINFQINGLASDEALVFIQNKDVLSNSMTGPLELVFEVPLSDGDVTRVFFGDRDNMIWQR